MSASRQIRNMCLLAFFLTVVVLPTSWLRGGEVVADLVQDWEQRVAADAQPIGNWRLLRGNRVYEPGNGLLELDRYEQGVSGNAGLACWSYGDSIFNRPSFTLDARSPRACILTYPQKGAEKNAYMGTPYIEWEYPLPTPTSLVIHLGLRNVGTNVSGGDGIAVKLYHVRPQTKAVLLKEVVLARSEPDAVAITVDVDFDPVPGDRLIVQVDPKKDGYGDGLEIESLQIGRSE